MLAAVIIVTVTALGGSNTTSRPPSSSAAARKLPTYWLVLPGQTYSQIAERTGLSVDQLERLNPSTDPYSLVPGQRLRLRVYSQRPRPKRLGPRFWTVHSGESFGSIAARTGQNIVKLERLNPRLKATTLQPGDKVRLRH
jgi:LysM repeat protein